jgi:hypothetical protein
MCGCSGIVGGYAFVLLRGGVAVHAVHVCVLCASGVLALIRARAWRVFGMWLRCEAVYRSPDL